MKNLKEELLDYYSKYGIDRKKVSDFWEYALLKIYATAIQKETDENFLQWDIISSTIHLPNRIEVDAWYELLKTSAWWHNYLKIIIEDCNVGNPIRFRHDKRATPTSIQNAFHIMNMKLAKIDVNEYDVVIEIGAGYGSLCRMIKRCGYINSYIIFDLEPMNILQKIYLMNASEIENTDYLDNLLIWNDENKFKYLINETNKRILVMGLWSLSEMPLIYREELLNYFVNREGIDFFGISR